ncbi:MAG: cob(I)yrinic acid a,c-diamide adenosyltransferase [Pseudobdellovibrionaceae bacterium]
MSSGKIYTKTGDQGKTRLVDGTQVPKSHPRLESYGTLDELNSCLGLVRAELEKQFKKPNNSHTAKFSEMDSFLDRVQNDLFSVGSRLACEDTKILASLPTISESAIADLEKQMDGMSEKLPALKEFILPGGTELSARLHMARTICRRAERNMTTLLDNSGYQLDFKYVNRLSDYLFIAARFANSLFGKDDVTWKKPNETR